MTQRQTKLRQFITLLLSVMLFTGLFLGLTPLGSVDAATISISKSAATIEKDATLQLSLDNASGKIKWKSSNTMVATVNKQGLVTAKSIGTANITATYNQKTYTCSLSVTDSTLHKIDTGFNKHYATLEVGAQLELTSVKGKKVTSWKSASKKLPPCQKE